MILFIAACKKDKIENSPVPYGDDVIASLDSNQVSGFLRVSDTIRIENDTILIPLDTTVKAEFFDLGDLSNPNPVFINSLSVNGATVPHSNFIGYFSSLPGKTIIPAIWDVKGTSIIPDFTFTNLKGMPFYNYRLLPDSIDCSKDYVVPLNGFSNTKYLYYFIHDNVSKSSMIGTPPGDSKSITFAHQSLSQFAKSSNASFEIRIENMNYQTLGGKTFAFANEIILLKKIRCVTNVL